MKELNVSYLKEKELFILRIFQKNAENESPLLRHKDTTRQLGINVKYTIKNIDSIFLKRIFLGSFFIAIFWLQ